MPRGRKKKIEIVDETPEVVEVPIVETIIEIPTLVVQDDFKVIDINGRKYREYKRSNGTTDIELIK